MIAACEAERLALRQLRSNSRRSLHIFMVFIEAACSDEGGVFLSDFGFSRGAGEFARALEEIGPGFRIDKVFRKGRRDGYRNYLFAPGDLLRVAPDTGDANTLRLIMDQMWQLVESRGAGSKLSVIPFLIMLALHFRKDGNTLVGLRDFIYSHIADRDERYRRIPSIQKVLKIMEDEGLVIQRPYLTAGGAQRIFVELVR